MYSIESKCVCGCLIVCVIPLKDIEFLDNNINDGTGIFEAKTALRCHEMCVRCPIVAAAASIDRILGPERERETGEAIMRFIGAF